MTLSRRTFLELSGAAAGASVVNFTAFAQQLNSASPCPELYWPPDRALPIFPQANYFDAADLTSLSGDEQGLLVSLEGIINRRQPRLYFYWGTDPTNLEWLKTTQVPYRISTTPWA